MSENLLMHTENNQQQVTQPDEEKAKQIIELKLKVNRIALEKSNKQLAAIKKEAKEKGYVLDDDDADEGNKLYIPLDDEQEKVIAQWMERKSKVQPSAIVFTHSVDPDGKKTGTTETKDGYPVSPTDKHNLWCATLTEATGSANQQYGYSVFSACYLACGHYKTERDTGANITGVLDAMRAFKPQDEVEGHLVARLIALHEQSMKFLVGAEPQAPGQTHQHIDLCVNRSAKLARLYNETLEALMRYRRRGEQKVTVTHQHVSVEGQAIINNGGNLNAIPRGRG